MASKAMMDFIFDLENSPPEKDAVFITYHDSNDPPIDHFRKHYLTCGELLDVIKGKVATDTYKVRVIADIGLRRRQKPVTGLILEVIPLDTVIDVYLDATSDPDYVAGWLKCVQGGWVAQQFTARV